MRLYVAALLAEFPKLLLRAVWQRIDKLIDSSSRLVVSRFV